MPMCFEAGGSQSKHRASSAGLMASVRGRLYDSGYFFDPVRREVETEFLPWLRQEALSALSNVATARSVPSSSMAPGWYQQAQWQKWLASQRKQHDSWVFLPSRRRSPASQRLQGAQPGQSPDAA